MFKALTGVPDEKARPAFTNIKQGPAESFAKFIDRLHSAIMAHPDLGEDMKAKFLDLLAFENANENRLGKKKHENLEALECCIGV